VTVAETQVETHVAKIVDALGPVEGMFVVGSALMGGFDPATSDLDLVAVVERPFDRKAARAALDELPVPFRELELVVYARGAKPPAYELNYPDGDGEPDFWFVLDAAIAQERVDKWLELLEPVTEDETRTAAAELLRWAEERQEEVHAARARHFLEHGEWITKEEAR
jgi:predicted nucleotidyltransferase